MSKKSQITCISTGLVALDLVTSSPRYAPDAPVHIHTGGSCGNVAAIIAATGVRSVPIARLGTDPASGIIRSELSAHGAETRFLSADAKDRAPIIFQYLKNDGGGGHRFDLRHPVSRKHLPQFKPVTKETFSAIAGDLPKADVFYSDRITPGAIQLAGYLKERGALVIFEPQRITAKELNRILPIVDVLKCAQGRLDELEGVSLPKRALTVIETLGSAGVRFQSTSGRLTKSWNVIPPIAQIAAVDTAGAGDWMTAYLICEAVDALRQQDKETIAKHLRHASAWSLLAILFTGARGIMRHMTMDVVRMLALRMAHADRLTDQLQALPAPSCESARKMKATLTALRL